MRGSVHRRRTWLAALALLAPACSGPPPAAGAASTPDPARARAESGAVAVAGRAPVTTSGIPAIVVLDPLVPASFRPPARVPALDQVARTFVPSILFVRTGFPAEFRNSDTELHNVNVKDASTREQAFNVAVATDEKYVYTFARDGVFDVSCDVHAGMSAQIVVSSTPYATVADGEGRFSFPLVEPGGYTATVYAGPRVLEHAVDVRGPRAELDLR